MLRKSTQDLFNQLDDLLDKEFDTTYDSANETESMSETSSLKLTETEQTSFYISTPNSPKKKVQFNHAKFQKRLQINKSISNNLLSMLDCLEDMLLEDYDLMETEINCLLQDLEVPLSTVSVPINFLPKKASWILYLMYVPLLINVR